MKHTNRFLTVLAFLFLYAPMAVLTAANNLPASTDTDSIASLEGVGYLIV